MERENEKEKEKPKEKDKLRDILKGIAEQILQFKDDNDVIRSNIYKDYDESFVNEMIELTITYLQNLLIEALKRNRRRDPETENILERDLLFLTKDNPWIKFKFAKSIIDNYQNKATKNAMNKSKPID